MIVEDKKPLAVANACYDHWVCKYGYRAVSTADNGTEFGRKYTHLLARFGIFHSVGAPSKPMAPKSALT